MNDAMNLCKTDRFRNPPSLFHFHVRSTGRTAEEFVYRGAFSLNLSDPCGSIQWTQNSEEQRSCSDMIVLVSKGHEKPGGHCRAVGLSASAAPQSTVASIHGYTRAKSDGCCCCCGLQLPAAGCRCFSLSSTRESRNCCLPRRRAAARPRHSDVWGASASEITAMEDLCGGWAAATAAGNQAAASSRTAAAASRKQPSRTVARHCSFVLNSMARIHGVPI
jgi:hypothetical protein